MVEQDSKANNVDEQDQFEDMNVKARSVNHHQFVNKETSTIEDLYAAGSKC